MRRIALSLLPLVTACAMSMPSAHEVMTTNRPCTKSTTLPGIDGAMAVVSGMVALAGLTTMVTAGTEGEDSDEEGIVKAGGLILALPGAFAAFAFGASSSRGSRSAAACQQRSMWGPHGPPPGI